MRKKVCAEANIDGATFFHVSGRYDKQKTIVKTRGVLKKNFAILCLEDI